MEYGEARQICIDFALKHNLTFTEEGECEFFWDCVGFLDETGHSYVDHNPISYKTYEIMPVYECGDAWPPEGIDAYHKHDCLVVLGRGEEPTVGLAKWVKKLESAGEVKIVKYRKEGGKGIVLLTGVGFTIMINNEKKKGKRCQIKSI